MQNPTELSFEEWRQKRRTGQYRRIEISRRVKELPCGCPGRWVWQRGDEWYCANTPSGNWNTAHKLFPPYKHASLDALRTEAEQRESFIQTVVRFVDQLIERQCDKQSVWKDRAGKTGLMGVNDFEGYCFERQTLMDHPEHKNEKTYDRYRVYRIRPVWHLMFGVYCLSNPASNNRAEGSVIEIAWPSIFRGGENDLLAIIDGDENATRELIARAERLKIEV